MTWIFLIGAPLLFIALAVFFGYRKGAGDRGSMMNTDPNSYQQRHGGGTVGSGHGL